jgi:uncharacterized protein DUF4339
VVNVDAGVVTCIAMATSDSWYVTAPNGQVHTLTLDQLDAAFQAGHIDEKTLVCQVGGTKWQTLKEVAGLDEPEAQPPVSVGPNSLMPVAVPAYAPRPAIVLDDDDIPSSSALRSNRPMLFVGIAAAALVLAGVGFTVRNLAIASADEAKPVTAPMVAATTRAPDPPKPTVEAAPTASAAEPRFSEEQMKRLSALDKAREREMDQKKKARTPPPARAPHRSLPPTAYVTGGSKFDPLNSSLK